MSGKYAFRSWAFASWAFASWAWTGGGVAAVSASYFYKLNGPFEKPFVLYGPSRDYIELKGD